MREDWAGPSFVLFPAATISGGLGDIHFDWEGLSDVQLFASDTKLYTFVAMIQRPASGGELRLWNLRYSAGKSNTETDASTPAVASTLIHYQAGDSGSV